MRARRSHASPTPSRSTSRAARSGDCSSMATSPAREMAPAEGARSPAINASKVDLPAPLRPTRPMRSAPMERSRFSKRSRPSGVAAETESRVTKDMRPHGQGNGKDEAVFRLADHGSLHRMGSELSTAATGVRQAKPAPAYGVMLRRTHSSDPTPPMNTRPSMITERGLLVFRDLNASRLASCLAEISGGLEPQARSQTFSEITLNSGLRKTVEQKRTPPSWGNGVPLGARSRYRQPASGALPSP